MKKIKTYQSAPNKVAEALEMAQIIPDFLPAPSQLVLKEATTRVTINLSKNSISFFKQYANNIGGSYQLMIKNLLDKYVQYYQISHQ